MLNFFQSDCVPCIQEHPELIEFVEQQRTLGPDGAEFYSVVFGDTRAARSSSSSTSVAATGRSSTPRATRSRSRSGSSLVPETWIIDPEGVVQVRLISKVTADELSVLVQQ